MVVRNINGAIEYAKKIGYPIVIKPIFSLYVVPLGTARDERELTELFERARDLSPEREVFLESLFR